MAKFPVDAPKARVLKALNDLGFVIVREAEHISLRRENADGSGTPMTIPNHRTLKGSTLRRICTQAGVERDLFLDAYNRSK
jgi:predicted RNA binding protein YcfA (HicA-like mRNA interferase family)